VIVHGVIRTVAVALGHPRRVGKAWGEPLRECAHVRLEEHCHVTTWYLMNLYTVGCLMPPEERSRWTGRASIQCLKESEMARIRTRHIFQKGDKIRVFPILVTDRDASL
jgi:hypothetical protein